jgi:hypothetical protein
MSKSIFQPNLPPISEISKIGDIHVEPINIDSMDRPLMENNTTYTINETTLYAQLNFTSNNSSNIYTLIQGQCLNINDKNIQIICFFSTETETDIETKNNYFCVYVECDDTTKHEYVQDVTKLKSFTVISCPEASTEGGKRKKHKKSKKKIKKGGKKSRRKTIRHL